MEVYNIDTKEYYKEYYLNNKEKYKKAHNIYYIKNKKYFRKNNDKYIIENQEKALYNSAKTSSKNFNRAFNIKIEDIVIPIYCPLLGIKLTNTRGQGMVQSNASIDRIDNSKGYIKGNIQVISRLANHMKQNASKEQLIMFAKGILKYYD